MASPTSRIAVALSATLVLGACQDTTAPEATAVPTTALAASLTGGLTTSATAATMAAFGADLLDATEPFLVVIDDAAARAALHASLVLLADALVAGDPAASTTALTAARARLAAVPGDAALHELAPVDLALDKAELTIAGTP